MLARMDGCDVLVLGAGVADLGGVDYARARREIEARLPPIGDGA